MPFQHSIHSKASRIMFHVTVQLFSPTAGLFLYRLGILAKYSFYCYLTALLVLPSDNLTARNFRRYQSYRASVLDSTKKPCLLQNLENRSIWNTPKFHALRSFCMQPHLDSCTEFSCLTKLNKGGGVFCTCHELYCALSLILRWHTHMTEQGPNLNWMKIHRFLLRNHINTSNTYGIFQSTISCFQAGNEQSSGQPVFQPNPSPCLNIF